MSVARSLPLAIRAHAAERPQALAVRDAAGDLTFVELDAGGRQRRGDARGAWRRPR